MSKFLHYVEAEDDKNLGLYSLTILKSILSLVLQIFLHLEAFKCNTTSDWLNHVKPIRSCVTFKFTYLGEKDKECSQKCMVNKDPGL